LRGKSKVFEQQASTQALLILLKEEIISNLILRIIRFMGINCKSLSSTRA